MRQVTPSLIRVINASGDPFSMGTGGLSVGGDIPGNTGEGGSIPYIHTYKRGRLYSIHTYIQVREALFQ
jgi:hypothetical protein